MSTKQPETLTAAPSSTRVCLVAKHALVVEQFRRVLADTTFQVSTAPPLEAAHRRAPELPPAEVYILDVHGFGPDATPLAAALLERSPTARMLAVAEAFSDKLAFDLLSLGVKGLLRCHDVPAQLASALTAVAAGGMWVPRDLVSRFMDAIVPALRKRHLCEEQGHLSQREQEVREALMLNLSNKEIATRLNISERTVKFHVSNLLIKLKVRRRSDLILMALSGPAH
ncbi:MAG: response regulator transcription factor [Myxococcota bacterium]